MSDTVFSEMSFASWYGAPTLMPTPHRHNEIEVNWVEQGALHYRFGGGMVRVPAERCLVFWGAIPHQLLAVEPETRLYWLTIPLNWFLGWRLPSAFHHAVLNDGFLLDSAPRPADSVMFAQWYQDFIQGDPALRPVLALEVEARLARFARSAQVAEPQASSAQGSSAHADAMARWIAEHYAEAIGVAEIASAVGLHPNYAMRVFQKAYGRSLVEMLTQHRFAHAQRLLVSTDQSVLEIALAVGFGSLSRFYAVFKARCGVAPQAYRARMGGL